MKNRNEKTYEQLFEDTFRNHEAEFDPRAWEHMKKLLEEEDNRPAVFVPPHKQNNQSNLTVILIIMSTLGLLSLCGWFILGTPSEAATAGFGSHTGTHKTESGNKAFAESGFKDTRVPETEGQSELTASPDAEHRPVKTAVQSASETGPSGAVKLALNVTAQQPIPSLEKNSEQDGSALYAGSQKDSSVTEVKTGKNYRVYTRKVWVPETYETIEKESGVFNDYGFIGLHITTENQRRSRDLSAGFNLQVMSGNKLPSAGIALHGGLDFGMQFYGSGLRSNVALNTSKSDSAYSRIQNYSTTLLGRLHLEFAASKTVVPYLNLMAGPRIYSASQVIRSYRNLTEYENRTSNSLHNSVSLLYGIGAGLRFRLNHTVSLDVRYEYINGSRVERLDMNKTTFNGVNYDKVMRQEKPRLEQFKVGLLFNLTGREYEEKVSEEGYMKVVSVDSIIISEQDSGLIILPCPCAVDCDKKKNGNTESKGNNDAAAKEAPRPIQSIPSEEEKPYIIRPNSSGSGNNGGNSGGSGSGSGGKKSFPGVKPPSRPTESGGR